MSVLKYTRSGNNRSLNLLGITIMEQTQNLVTGTRFQSFFGGVISTKRESSFDSSYAQKVVNIFGRPIISYILENNVKKHFLLGKNILNISLFDTFKKQYFKYFSQNYDDIYILKANCGEAYLTLTYIIQTLIDKNKSKNPLLVATAKYHIDMIKLICPQIPYILIENFSTKISETEFEIDDFKFFILYNPHHYTKTVEKIKQSKIQGSAHYFKSILEELNINPQEIKRQNVKLTHDIKNSMLQKVINTGLNLNKFIFLAPEAQTCKLYDDDFWSELIIALNARGYDVFVNITGNDIKLLSNLNYKTCNLTLSEAFALAKQSKKIVSLRSGFTEFLIQTDVKLDVLYTQTKHNLEQGYLNANQTISNFSLLALPYINTDKIREFNMFKISSQTAIDMILEDLE